MRALTRYCACALALGLCQTAGAAEPAPPAASQPPVSEENAFEPEVTITSKGTEIHEEYRHNGQLYMVKVIPAKGPPYYLIYDERGRSRRSDLEPDIVAPSWVIKRF